MRSRAITLPVLLTGTFMGFLDLFLVIVAVPSIAGSLHASTADAQLVLSIYVVAYGAALVVGGRLGDRYGRRRIFGAGMAAFTLFSAGCTAAPDLPALVVLRGLQGAGAALTLPQVLATIQALYDGEPRRCAVLAYTTALGAAGALGQVIGGGLLALDVLHLGWRVLFMINVPIGVLALALLGTAVPETRAPRPPAIDVAGAVVLGAALTLMLLGLGIGPAQGWPPLAWALLAVGAAIAVGLRPLERRAPEPLLPAGLLRERSVRLGLAATLAFYAANNAVFIGFTLWLQDVRGLDALGAGAAYLPLGLAYMASTLRGRRPGAPQGPRAMVLGSTVMVGGLAVSIAAALLGAGPLILAALNVVFGIGLGFVYPAIVASVLARVPPGEEGAATGVLLTATQVSNALGIAIVTAAFAATRSLPVALAIAAGLVALVIPAGRLLGRSDRACAVRPRAHAPAATESHATRSPTCIADRAT